MGMKVQATMLLPSATITIAYDDDAAGAADALLAVLRPATDLAELPDEIIEDPNDETA
jgi:hypothetical protein